MLRKSLLLILLFLIFIFNSSFFNLNKNYVLYFCDKKNNKTVSFNVKENDIFIIKYRHSVALTPVIEFYKIINGKIVLYEFHFYDQCAGLPTEPCGDEKLILEDGVFKLQNINRNFEKIYYGVYKNGEFKLIINNKIIDLSEKFGNSFINIEIRRN